MRGRAAVAAAALALLTAATPAAAKPPTPLPTYTYPPPAPAPTAHAKSPGAPDPHPPAGGLAPDGRIAGGTALAARGLVLPTGAPKLPKHIPARAWVLVDLDSGDVLAARDPHGRYQPASILKLLTCVTLIPRLPGDTKVTATRTAAETEGSHAGLFPGGHYTVDDLFKGLLLVSGNDTATALAQAAGGVRKTVGLMNQEALALGAYDTFVETPSGLDGWKQLTSPYDMALILRAALELPRFIAYDRVLHTFLPRNRDYEGHRTKVPLWNQNAFWLQNVKGALVAKSGFTDAAQTTFVAAMERDGRRLGVVLMRTERWPLDHWQQADRLMQWGFRLPPGTAPVGRLEAPPHPDTAPTTTTTPGARRVATVRSAAAATDEESPLPWVVAGLVLAGAAAGGWQFRRKRATTH